MPSPVLLYGTTGEALLSSPRSPDSPDSSQTARLAGRGEMFVANLFNGTGGLAMEGSLFTAQTATPGTGITVSVATGTTFSDTQAMLVINNTDLSSGGGGSAGQGRSIYLQYITWLVTTVATSQTSHHIQGRLDATQRGSGGTALVGKNNNGLYGATPVAQVLVGNPTVAAASAAVRNMGRRLCRSQIYVVQDQVILKFGSQEMAAGGVGVASTTATVVTLYMPDVVIAPGQSFVLNEWAVARAAALSAEVEVGWVER
jgi:hypothetical protein